MVCKNCGADLKPGIKYCLECGNYIDEEVTDGDRKNDVGSIGDRPQYTFKTNKRKKKKTSATDILIYSLLALVLVVSVIVIIVTLINGSKKEEEKPDEPEVREDASLTIDFYKLVVPGEYLYDVQGDILYVSDDVNYTFSYRNTTDDYDAYAEDLDVVTKELEGNKYEVFTSQKKIVDDTEFLCYKLRANGSTKYLYLTKASSYYTTLGVIEIFDNGDWEAALPVIAKLNKSLIFLKTPTKIDDDKDDDKDEDSSTTTTVTETIQDEYTVSDAAGSIINSFKKKD